MKEIKTLITILFLVFAVSAKADGVQVKSHLNPVSILIGQQSTLTLEVTAPKNAKVEMPSLDSLTVAGTDVKMITPGVEILDVETDTTDIDNANKKIICKYTLTCFDESKYSIPALEVTVDKKVYKTNKINFTVATVAVDTTNLEKFYPPKDIQDVPFLWSEWSPYFWLSVITLLLIAIFIYLYVRLKQNKPIISRIIIIKHVPAHQKALTAIDHIKQETIENVDDRKAYYTKLTDALREYIRERFGFNAMEMTSSEIIAHLQESGDKTMIDELKELFRTADLVKFAKHTPDMSEDDLNLVNAIQFIDQTKTEDKPSEEKVVPQLSKEDQKKKSNRLAVKISLWVLGVVVVATIIYIGINVFKLLY